MPLTLTKSAQQLAQAQGCCKNPWGIRGLAASRRCVRKTTQ